MNQDYQKGFNDALSVVENEINGLVRSLRSGCNPNPLGSMVECLAAAEIQAFELVLDTIKENRK